tara:strand:+ start:1157 stop:1612 length:456 start_codon:yes stop_codon:yes gene_type:complete
MIEPVLRLKLSDILGTKYEKDILDKLHHINNLGYFPAFPVYLWYDRDNDRVDLSRLKDFIVKWEETGEFRSKTIIVPEFFDRFRDFVWYDIIPRETFDSHHIQYSRFSYIYSNSDDILNGLDEFIETYKFTIREKPIRKQKRNDYEDSNRR